MKKADIYEIRHLLEKIRNDFNNDAPRGNGNCGNRGELINESVESGVDICNKYLSKMKPML